jgi:hypothetical protein
MWVKLDHQREYRWKSRRNNTTKHSFWDLTPSQCCGIPPWWVNNVFRVRLNVSWWIVDIVLDMNDIVVPVDKSHQIAMFHTLRVILHMLPWSVAWYQNPTKRLGSSMITGLTWFLIQCFPPSVSLFIPSWLMSFNSYNNSHDVSIISHIMCMENHWKLHVVW